MGGYSFLVVNFFVTALVTLVLSYRYGDWRKQNKVVTTVHCLSLWLPALILTTLPVDIATAFYVNCTKIPVTSSPSSVGTEHCRPPWLYADSRVLLVFWHTVYWSSQFLTWLLIPLMRSFSTAGDFTTFAKLKTALLDNALYYASYLAIFLMALVYLLVKKAIRLNFGYLKVLLITAANTWGLFLVVLFLGYGLVAVPRSLWVAGTPIASLRRAYFTLSKRNTELADEEEKLDELLREIEQLKSALPLSHPLQPHLLTVAKQAQNCSPPIHSSRTDTSVRTRSTDLSGLTLKQLVRLHRSLKSTQHRRARAEALYWEAVERAIWIEDLNTFRNKRRVMAFAQAHSGWLTRQIAFHLPSLASPLARVQAYWYAYARLWLIRVSAICLAAVSGLMVWSECTFSVHTPTLSVVAWLVKAQAYRHDYFLLEVTSFLTLGYLSLVVFYTVFRLRIFNYYRLVGSHHTDENSLLFCGALLCRLIPSLCLNFLGLAHLDSHISRTTLTVPQTIQTVIHSALPIDDRGLDVQLAQTFNNSSHVITPNLETTYTQFMGHLDVIPFIARGFNIYFPVLVVLLCVLTYVRFGDRVLHYLGIPQLLENYTDADRLSADSPDSLVEDAIQDGRLLLRKERMLLSRRERVSSDKQLQSSVFSAKSNQFPAEDRVHLLHSNIPDDHCPTRSPVSRAVDQQGWVDDDDEMDMLPSFHSNPLGSSQLVEYSEAEIESQFALGRR